MTRLGEIMYKVQWTRARLIWPPHQSRLVNDTFGGDNVQGAVDQASLNMATSGKATKIGSINRRPEYYREVLIPKKVKLYWESCHINNLPDNGYTADFAYKHLYISGHLDEYLKYTFIPDKENHKMKRNKKVNLTE